MIAQNHEPLPVNRWPLNRAAKERLLEAKVPPDPQHPYLLQLLALGFDRGLPLPGQGNQFLWDLSLAADQLLDPKLKPVPVLRWLLDNPNAGDQAEQSRTLLSLLQAAPSWEAAAQGLMEWFYDRKAAQDPYYRPSATLPA